jgi:hypothetical protein
MINFGIHKSHDPETLYIHSLPLNPPQELKNIGSNPAGVKGSSGFANSGQVACNLIYKHCYNFQKWSEAVQRTAVT